MNLIHKPIEKPLFNLHVIIDNRSKYDVGITCPMFYHLTHYPSNAVGRGLLIDPTWYESVNSGVEVDGYFRVTDLDGELFDFTDKTIRVDNFTIEVESESGLPMKNLSCEVAVDDWDVKSSVFSRSLEGHEETWVCGIENNIELFVTRQSYLTIKITLTDE